MVFYWVCLTEAEYAVVAGKTRVFSTVQVHDKDRLSPRTATSLAYSTRFGEETRMWMPVLLGLSLSCHARLSSRDETFTDKSILPTQRYSENPFHFHKLSFSIEGLYIEAIILDYY